MDPSSVPPALTVQVCFPSARAAVLDNLNRQREEGRLCDLSIHVQGKVFKAHRCVLAASSPYFHDQVLLKNVTTVSLPSVMDPVAFESVLSSAYTGQLSIVHDDIVNYVTVASFLQMWHIVDKCTEILKRPRPAQEATQPDISTLQARRQSPSSTDCLYLDREGRRKDAKPDALPPLATWRRPQQLSRWGSSRPTLLQHSADSRVDSLSYAEGDEASYEDACRGKSGHFAQAGPSSETFRQKVRSLHEKNLGREGGETQRKKERRELEADEGVGEEAAVKKEGFTQTGTTCLCFSGDSQADLSANEDSGRALPRLSLADIRDKVQPSSVPPWARAESLLGEPSAILNRGQWQASAWSESRAHQAEVLAKAEPALRCLDTETYDQMGEIPQRPPLPTSPDFAASESGWASPDASPLAVSARHLPLPPCSPPMPSSSSSHAVAGGANSAGKVHLCHCGKAFTLKSMRDRHVKMQHLNLRPFACPFCNKSFKMKHHLTKHLKTHGALRPHECGVCGKLIIWRDSFLRHQARCQRSASSSSSAAPREDAHTYRLDGVDAFLSVGGRVKVEEVDFQGEMEDGVSAVSGLLGSVTGMAEELPTQPLEAGAHVYKEEAGGNFSGRP
ncbi:zinc finger and BTB domain-containing protein 43 [Stigmatopora nigra]